MLQTVQVTSAPSSFERLDQHRRLDRHVQAAGDARALERLRRAVLGAERHEAGHLGLGDLDLLAAPIGEREVRHTVVLAALGRDALLTLLALDRRAVFHHYTLCHLLLLMPVFEVSGSSSPPPRGSAARPSSWCVRRG